MDVHAGAPVGTRAQGDFKSLAIGSVAAERQLKVSVTTGWRASEHGPVAAILDAKPADEIKLRCAAGCPAFASAIDVGCCIGEFQHAADTAQFRVNATQSANVEFGGEARQVHG